MVGRVNFWKVSDTYQDVSTDGSLRVSPAQTNREADDQDDNCKYSEADGD